MDDKLTKPDASFLALMCPKEKKGVSRPCHLYSPAGAMTWQGAFFFNPLTNKYQHVEKARARPYRQVANCIIEGAGNARGGERLATGAGEAARGGAVAAKVHLRRPPLGGVGAIVHPGMYPK
eukprot:1194932-Prorocentrum_minimum.AAC.1